MLSEAEQLAKAERKAAKQAKEDEIQKQDKAVDDAVAATVRSRPPVPELCFDPHNSLWNKPPCTGPEATAIPTEPVRCFQRFRRRHFFCDEEKLFVVLFLILVLVLVLILFVFLLDAPRESV